MLGGAKRLLQFHYEEISEAELFQILYFGWTSPSIININNIKAHYER